MYGGTSGQTLNVLVAAMFEKDEYYQNKKITKKRKAFDRLRIIA